MITLLNFLSNPFLLYFPFVYSFIFGWKAPMNGLSRLFVCVVTTYILSVVFLTLFFKQPFDFPLNEVLPRTAIFAFFHVLVGIPLMYIGVGVRRFLESK